MQYDDEYAIEGLENHAQHRANLNIDTLKDDYWQYTLPQLIIRCLYTNPSAYGTTIQNWFIQKFKWIKVPKEEYSGDCYDGQKFIEIKVSIVRWARSQVNVVQARLEEGSDYFVVMVDARKLSQMQFKYCYLTHDQMAVLLPKFPAAHGKKATATEKRFSLKIGSKKYNDFLEQYEIDPCEKWGKSIVSTSVLEPLHVLDRHHT